VVDVLNGGRTGGLASQVSAAVVQAGYQAGLIENTTPLTATQVLYGPGEAANASQLAGAFGVSATASAAIEAGHIEIKLGAGATSVPSIPAGGPAAAKASTSPSPAGIPTSGPQGGAVGAEKGIPCVS
jgi:hypothetical protein